jgi:hypothetical protein
VAWDNNAGFRMEGKRNFWDSHSLGTIICCVMLLTGITILSLLGILGSWGFYALILLCPLLHLLLMRRKETPKDMRRVHMMKEGR